MLVNAWAPVRGGGWLCPCLRVLLQDIDKLLPVFHDSGETLEGR